MKKQKPFKYTVKSPLLLKKIKGINKEQIIGISIDVAKDFYRVLIFDFKGKIITRPFSIDVFKTGYSKLLRLIGRAVKRRRGKKVFFALEPMGCYGYQLAKTLNRDFGEVYYVNAAATASNRNQKMLRGLKTDDVDCCSIGDLLIRGECFPYKQEDSIYLDLKQNVYWREKKHFMVDALTNQILSRVEKMFPGLTSRFEKNKPLYSTHYLMKFFSGFVNSGLSLSYLRKTNPQQLVSYFANAGFQTTRSRVKITQAYFDRLLVSEDNELKKDLELFSRDIKILETVQSELKEVEEEMINLMLKTPARFISGQIKGVPDIFLAIYIGCIGDINKYDDAGKVYSKSGLCPKIKQSGSYVGKSLGIKRTGNKLLRVILFKMATLVMWHEPYFRNYYYYLRKTRKKPWKKAIIAVARKLNRVMFAMIKNQTDYNPPASSVARNFDIVGKPKELVSTFEVSPVLEEYDEKHKS